MTVLAFHDERDVDDALETVRSHLAANGILAYPTETVYGLGCRPVDESVRDLARFKQRPGGKPFLLLISSRPMAEHLGLHFSDAASAMATAFWPGPLTLVLPGGEGKLPDSLRGPEGGIAVRWTSHRGVSRLINGLGFPITSTSANRPGAPPAPGSGGVIDTFRAEIKNGRLLVLDGGVLGNVPSSTLIDCTRRVPRMVRTGAIPLPEIQAKVGSLAP